MFAWFTFSLATNFFPDLYDASNGQYWAIAIIASVVFFVSVLAHELGHSRVAQAYGIPVKSITLFFLGGVAQIARDAPRPMVEGLVAVAGPVVSLVLGGIFFGLHVLFNGISEPASALFFYLGYANVAVGAFNLVPGFPMDGGRIFRAVVWGIKGDLLKATRAATTLGRGVGMLFIAGGVGLSIWDGSFFSGMIFVFLGFFLMSSAQQSMKQMAMRQRLIGLRTQDVMIGAPTIPPGLDLRSLVNNYISLSGQRFFFVGQEGHTTGTLSLSDISLVARERWSATTVGEVAAPLQNLPRIDANESAQRALDLLEDGKMERLLVAKGESMIGFLTAEHIFVAATRGDRAGALS